MGLSWMRSRADEEAEAAAEAWGDGGFDEVSFDVPKSARSTDPLAETLLPPLAPLAPPALVAPLPALKPTLPLDPSSLLLLPLLPPLLFW